MNKVPIEYLKFLEYFALSLNKRNKRLKGSIVLCLYDAGFINTNSWLSSLTPAGEDAKMVFDLLQ